jgi:hypothetical protein
VPSIFIVAVPIGGPDGMAGFVVEDGDGDGGG